jgi:hypothetical protein
LCSNFEVMVVAATGVNVQLSSSLAHVAEVHFENRGNERASGA